MNSWNKEFSNSNNKKSKDNNKFSKRTIHLSLFITTMSLIMLLVFPISTALSITDKERYDSGYQYGCNDAKIPGILDDYIKQLAKEPSSHTKAFMQGYDDGLNDCSKKITSSDINPKYLTDEDSFIVQITLVDDLNIDIDSIFYDLVNIYIHEYPDYGRFNMDLGGALYSDSSDGEYTFQIRIPAGLIETDEIFHVCIEDSEDQKNGQVFCYEMTNSPQKKPERIIIRV
ncbi:hypothetical protein [Candidatus Nitrosocosmicus franklandus]|uniref:hypothetical protein n=1 Tax=Candidatus Nitrosocosmicus franklandianus TaxID=1798806 RepID=UPI00106D1A57|nr:hypothetical protein [Candidatus Nitrosocosmicus franklandus]